ncbi:hypothetical protein OAI46_04420 [Alphaproteobacteria bacterium]|nr:hypothetical protein [Alphaproteobacteria bacterium]MDB2668802.1 hypothetical protein [Alphaproteobacteria bacterium]MDC0131292.1 hypothetical protein [Alphaproteobacteria bacterium]MDC0148091.1 hypothetical protein [Alphaproteobacteria bacterium]MDC1241141.1 hypothetical protein [bacterium]
MLKTKKCQVFKALFSLSIMFGCFVMLGGPAMAKSCSLDGVEFGNLTQQQEQVLTAIGAKCNNGPQKDAYLDVGYVLLDGKKLSYVEFAANGYRSMFNKEVEVIGYLERWSQKTQKGVAGYQRHYLDGYVFAGKPGQTFLNYTSPKIRFLTWSLKPDFSKGETSRSPEFVSRKEKHFQSNYKILNTVNKGAGLIKVKGKINYYDNDKRNGYITATEVKVLARK